MSRDPRHDDPSTRDAERDAAGERAPGDHPADRRAIGARDRRPPEAGAANWAATAALICGVAGLVLQNAEFQQELRDQIEEVQNQAGD